MLITDHKLKKECCFNCKYGRIEGNTRKVAVVNGETFFLKDALKEKYPDVEISNELLVDYIPERSTCHKTPPRISGGVGVFPLISTDNWCGSYKSKE